jgi:hypothetical protein
MGGKGSGRKANPLNALKAQTELRTPIANEMFLPNHSGIGVHPEFKKNVDNEFLKLDCSNDPLTGSLELVCNNPLITLKDSSGTGSSTLSAIQFKDDADDITAYFGFPVSVLGTFMITNSIQDEDIGFYWNNGGTLDYIFIDASESELNLNSNKIVNVADPTANQDAATKKYVDDNAFSSPLTTKGDLYTYDSDDARLAVGTNDQILVADSSESSGLDWKNRGTKFVSMTVEEPGSTDDITICRFNEAITITKVIAILTGSSSPTNSFYLKQGTNRTSGTSVISAMPSTASSTTTGDSYTSFNDATVPANSFLWYDGNGTTGTCDTFHLTVFYTVD